MSPNNPYPTTKPRLHAAWLKGYEVGVKGTTYGRGTPCQIAFNGGAQRRLDDAAAGQNKLVVWTDPDGGQRDMTYDQCSDLVKEAIALYSIPEVPDMFQHGVPLDQCGCSLFAFIVREVSEAADRDDAIRMMEVAVDDLNGVIAALWRAEAS